MSTSASSPLAFRSSPPAGLEWEASLADNRGSIVLRVSRRSARSMLMLLWCGFGILWSALVLVLTGPTESIRFVAMPILAVVLYVLWRVLRRANRSRLTLDANMFVARSGPVPETGVVQPTNGILRFESVRYAGMLQVRGKEIWLVRMHTDDGRAVRLPLPIDLPGHTDFVASALNELLLLVREPSAYRD
jgi:hypothetical protein